MILRLFEVLAATVGAIAGAVLIYGAVVNPGVREIVGTAAVVVAVGIMVAR